MFNKKFDVIAIGSATRDVFLKAEGFELRKHADSPTGEEQCFPLGTKIEIKEIVFTTGGGGTNAAVTFARQGFKTACIGVVGDDFNGQEILKELHDEGIETKFFQKHSDPVKSGDHGTSATAYSVILVHSNAERTILSYKGEGQHFDVKKIPFDKLDAKWFFVDSLGGHFDLLEAIINHALKNKIKIAFNPGGKELAHGLEKLKPILKNIDIYITNKEEGAGLVDSGYQNQSEILNKLKSFIPGIVVLTDGHNGVRMRDKDNKEYSAGVPDSPVVERTGAGDAFSSGFVCEYARSGSIEKAIQFATANASSVVTKFGGKAGILSARGGSALGGKKGDWGPWPLVEVSKN